MSTTRGLSLLPSLLLERLSDIVANHCRESVNAGDIATDNGERWSAGLTVKRADILAHLQKPNPGELASIWLRVEEGR